jgi:hypothetical protein
MSKKVMNMLLALLFACLAFFGLGEFGLHSAAHSFFPERLSNRYQCFRRTFSEISKKFDAGPLFYSSRNRISPCT